MANKSGGASKTSQANNYKTNKVWERNRLRKLKKLLISQPNNKNIPTAIAGVHYRRKVPKVRVWNSTKIRTAFLFKQFVGRVDLNIFSNNEKVSNPALLTPGPYSSYKHPVTQNETVMFQLGTRARWGGML